ncbi:cell adhesion molecule 2-like, partial [Clarias magur]
MGFQSCSVSLSYSGGFLFPVTSTPSAVTLRKGEQVRLTCSWSISITGVKVRWFKDHQGFNQTSKLPKTKNIKDCETLVIINAVRNDAGFYICEVTQDVPRLMRVNGTGTKVMFERENEPETFTTTLSPTTEQHGDRPDSSSIPRKKHGDRPDSHTIPRTERAAEEVYEDGPVIFAIRCVPFITLLLAVCFLSRGGPRTKNNRPRA